MKTNRKKSWVLLLSASKAIWNIFVVRIYSFPLHPASVYFSVVPISLINYENITITVCLFLSFYFVCHSFFVLKFFLLVSQASGWCIFAFFCLLLYQRMNFQVFQLKIQPFYFICCMVLMWIKKRGCSRTSNDGRLRLQAKLTSALMLSIWFLSPHASNYGYYYYIWKLTTTFHNFLHTILAS